MKKLFLLLLLFASIGALAQSEPFSKRTVVNVGANTSPWEILYGPNDSLWVTESKGYKVDRIKISSGVKTTLLDIGNMNDDWASGTGPQGGLMGMVLHPALYSSDPVVRAAKPWVYLAYVYKKTTPNTVCNSPGLVGGCPFTTTIVRYDYSNGTLINPVTILNTLPGSSDHNSGRLVMSPTIESGSDAAHTQYRLYYTIGDMGAGQLTNTNRTNNAQVLDVFEGKILRLNTESDGDAGADAWIPNDNPFYNGSPFTPRDYVYSMGHRNPQGLDWGYVSGAYRLYSSEQSDKADDEINLIQAGNNYGWDKVSGKCDGDVNGFQIGGQTIVNEVTNCTGTTEPIFTTFHHNATWPSSYPTGTANALWPTIASSSIEVYTKNVIPGWAGSIFITPLKEDMVYRLQIAAGGTTIFGDTISYFRGDGNRIRRIISDPTGLKFYVARDNNIIMEYTYTGITLPVHLTYFKGSLQNNVAALEWASSSELNTSEFIVERSIDGVSYQDIGSVLASGNNSTTITYNYSDKNVITQQADLVYYRLRMIDKDGAFKYSNIVTISMSEKTERIIVSPNPVSGSTKVSITVAGSGNAQWKVVDNSGLIIMQNSIQLRPGINTMSLDMSKLAAGLYYLNVSGSGIDQKVKLQKL